MASPYWQMVKDREFDQVPDTYLDWLKDRDWVNPDTLKAINKELETRKRSHYSVADRFGKTLE